MSDSAREQPVIEFDRVSFRVNGRSLVQDLVLSVNRGETLVLLGRSGSGKTTSLKLINRLLEPIDGVVRVDGKRNIDWDPIRLRRGIGYVIQDGGLFPHFTVERNISLVPQIENWPQDRIRERVCQVLDLVGLNQELSSRYPHQLSGGQRQRVGVARALAADPPILLMDEPFGALDPITRFEIQKEFRALQQRVKKTVIFVTHDLREALLLGDRIALMENGSMVVNLSRSEFEKSDHPLVRAYMEAFTGSAESR
jgi:osmoprotectant transport system ATP-binding protein